MYERQNKWADHERKPISFDECKSRKSTYPARTSVQRRCRSSVTHRRSSPRLPLAAAPHLAFYESTNVGASSRSVQGSRMRGFRGIWWRHNRYRRYYERWLFVLVVVPHRGFTGCELSFQALQRSISIVLRHVRHRSTEHRRIGCTNRVVFAAHLHCWRNGSFWLSHFDWGLH